MNINLNPENPIQKQKQQQQQDISSDQSQTNKDIPVFNQWTIRVGKKSGYDLQKIKENSYDQITERLERLQNEKIFKKLEDQRKKNLMLIPQKNKFTNKILLTMVNTIFQSIVALIAGLVYVIHTYYEEDKSKQSTFAILEFMIALIFTVDYVYNFRKAKNKLKFFFKPINIFDFITITPVLISIIPGTDTDVGNFLKQFIGIVRILRIFRVFRIYKLSKESYEESFALREYWELKRKSFVILSSLFLSIFICSGLIQAFTTMNFGFKLSESVLTFDEALYFITVTCSTVGYGDYAPQNELSQFIILIMIIIIIFIVTKTTSDFNDLTKNTSEFKLPYKVQKKQHIFLIGKINHQNLLKFAKEFYHPDNDANNQTPILIMSTNEPSDEMKFLMKSPFFQNKIHYIVGNPLRAADLKLAKLNSNKVFIIANQFSQCFEQDDVFSILATQLIKEQFPKTKIYTQLGCPENMNWSFWIGWEKVMCTNQIKMGLISSNSFIPGFSTMVSNLIMSFSEQNHSVTDYSPWKLEYIHGMNHEFYLLKFKHDKNQFYIGKQFKQVCGEIFQKSGILLIGLKVKNMGLSQNGIDYYDTLFNPLDHVIQQGDVGLILAKDVKQCYSIFSSPGSVQFNEFIEKKQDYEAQYDEQTPFQEINAQSFNQQIHNESICQLEYQVYNMQNEDVKGKISGHILVFGQLEYLDSLIFELRNTSDRHICYISRNPPKEDWENITRKYKRILYFTCQYFNISELEKTGIQDAFSCIVLGGLDNSDFQDSRILPLTNIIEENYSHVNFTVEMTNENNVKYLVSKNRQFEDHLSKSNYLHPLYASSNLFYSASLDYLMGKVYHIESVPEIILKLVSPQSVVNHSSIKENNEIGVIQIPQEFANRATYQQVFHYFINKEIPVIPIAIYRAPHVLDNQFSFIYTNPSPQAPILKGDILIVIGDFNGRSQQSEEFLNQSVSVSRDGGMHSLYQQQKASYINRIKPDLSNINEISEEVVAANQKFNIQDQNMLEECLFNIGVSKEQHQELMTLNQELADLLKYTSQMKQKFLDGDGEEENYEF